MNQENKKEVKSESVEHRQTTRLTEGQYNRTSNKTSESNKRKLERLRTIQFTLSVVAFFYFLIMLYSLIEGNRRVIETLSISLSLILTTLIGAVIGSSFD